MIIEKIENPIGQMSRISHVSNNYHLAIIFEGTKSTFPEDNNAVLLIEGSSVKQVISFLTANCI
jgi:hypothetical protein